MSTIRERERKKRNCNKMTNLETTTEKHTQPETQVSQTPTFQQTANLEMLAASNIAR